MVLYVGKKKGTHWEVDDQEIRYYRKPKNFYSKAILTHEISIQDINHIDIYFISTPKDNSILYGPGSHSHSVMFEVVMNDESIKMFDILTSLSREELQIALRHLQNIGIKFNDKYELIDVILGNGKIQDGIEGIIKYHDLSYSRKKQ